MFVDRDDFWADSISMKIFDAALESFAKGNRPDGGGREGENWETR